MLKMEKSGSHQLTIGPHQGNDNPHQAESGGSQHSQSDLTLNKGEIMREVGKPCTLIGVSLVGKVMCPMQRMRKTCNVKLTS